MRNALKTVMTVAVAAGALLAVRTAGATAGVAFVHGTGDQTDATNAYWTSSSLNTMANGRQYMVASYQGGSKDAFSSYADVATQIDNWATPKGMPSNGMIIVTHSNGINPVRYLIAHPTATAAAQRVYNYTVEVIAIAGSMKGTPLADSVTNGGTLASFASGILGFFGNSYNNPAVWQQRTDRMASYNSSAQFGENPASNGGTRNQKVNGVWIDTIVGSDVYAAIWSGDAYCGGYGSTAGLKAAKIYGWGYSACSDGFIGCDSADYLGYQDNPSYDSRLNHNQSRRSCHGSGTLVANDIASMIGYAIPADYAISPAAQACNATTQGWQSAAPYSGYNYWYGCTSAMKTDANTDIDCFAAYGGDNGLVAPTNFASTGYANSAYYSGGSVCPDSWLGDGECDMCLLAKYGYDSKSGSTGASDCVNTAGDDGVVRSGTGKTNKCADLSNYNPSTASSTGASIGYHSYTATH